MPQCESVVVYDGLPISSGGAHSINRLSPDQALQAWRRFLQTCAQHVEVDAVIRVDDQPGPPASRQTLDRLDRAFPTRRETSVQLRHVPEDRIDQAVELMAEISPQPADQWGNAAVHLFIEARFLLRHPADGGGLWPGQGRDQFGDFTTPSGVMLGISSARLTIGHARSMGLMLTLPMASDADLTLIRPWLQDHLPFRLSDKHWTRWTLNKNGNTYRPKRLTHSPLHHAK